MEKLARGLVGFDQCLCEVLGVARSGYYRWKAAARREIEDHFKNHFGKTPHQYLGNRFSERRNSRDKTSARRTFERPRGDDYER